VATLPLGHRVTKQPTSTAYSLLHDHISGRRRVAASMCHRDPKRCIHPLSRNSTAKQMAQPRLHDHDGAPNTSMSSPISTAHPCASQDPSMLHVTIWDMYDECMQLHLLGHQAGHLVALLAMTTLVATNVPCTSFHIQHYDVGALGYPSH
jgi:hypothetical protein